MRCDRRTFIGAVACGLFAVQACVEAQPAKVYRIGFLSLRGAPSAPDDAFVQALHGVGYAIGRNLIIEYRWANGDGGRLRAMAEELVRIKVDVIVASATPAIRAAMRATNTIPIVMSTSPDPVGTGVVTNLSHPGGNVTGVSIQSSDLAAKRVQLLHEMVKGLTRIAFVGLGPRAPAPQTQTSAEIFVTEARAAARQMGIEVNRYTIAEGGDLAGIFAAIKRDGCQALMVQIGPRTYELRKEIIAMAAGARLADRYDARDFVDIGGLVSYGPDVEERYRRAAWYVDRILKGAKPGDLAVEQPAKFELVVNLKTAKSLGLAIPQSLLLRADAVIQ